MSTEHKVSIDPRNQKIHYEAPGAHIIYDDAGEAREVAAKLLDAAERLDGPTATAGDE